MNDDANINDDQDLDEHQESKDSDVSQDSEEVRNPVLGEKENYDGIEITPGPRRADEDPRLNEGGI